MCAVITAYVQVANCTPQKKERYHILKPYPKWQIVISHPFVSHDVGYLVSCITFITFVHQKHKNLT